MFKQYNPFEITGIILCVSIILNILIKNDEEKASVLIADDWVLLRTAAINLDNTLLTLDHYNEAPPVKKIVQTNRKGAFVVQDGWRLTLYTSKKANTLLGGDEHNVSLIPVKINNSLKWICVTKGTENVYTLPKNTNWKASNISNKLLPITCR